MKNESSIAVIGSNLSLGQPRKGTEKGYAWLKSQGLISHLKSLFSKVFDAGSLEEGLRETKRVKDMFNFSGVMAFNEKLAERVSRLNRDFDLTLNMGGDHSVAMGSVSGSLSHDPRVKIVWVDAHADFNTPQTSPSGNLHGMPLSFLTGQAKESLPSWMRHLHPKSVALIGLRDVDSQEAGILRELGVLNFTMEDICSRGMEAVLRQTLKALDPEGESFFHLSFDVDALDPSVLPSTGTAVPGGLAVEEGLVVIQGLFQTGRLKTFDLVEVNPEIGSERDLAKTKETVFQLLEGLHAS